MDDLSKGLSASSHLELDGDKTFNKVRAQDLRMIMILIIISDQNDGKSQIFKSLPRKK